jgi:hypothetical protein
MYEDNDDEFPSAADIEKRFLRVMDLLVGAEDVIRSTIFSRTPIFFSLFLVLDRKRISLAKLKARMSVADEQYAQIDDGGVGRINKEAVDFHSASTASTQRIAQRRLRQKYLESLLGA